MGRDSVRLRSHIRAMLLPRRWEGVGGEMSRVVVWPEELIRTKSTWFRGRMIIRQLFDREIIIFDRTVSSIHTVYL